MSLDEALRMRPIPEGRVQAALLSGIYHDTGGLRVRVLAETRDTFFRANAYRCIYAAFRELIEGDRELNYDTVWQLALSKMSDFCVEHYGEPMGEGSERTLKEYLDDVVELEPSTEQVEAFLDVLRKEAHKIEARVLRRDATNRDDSAVVKAQAVLLAAMYGDVAGLRQRVLAKTRDTLFSNDDYRWIYTGMRRVISSDGVTNRDTLWQASLAAMQEYWGKHIGGSPSEHALSSLRRFLGHIIGLRPTAEQIEESLACLIANADSIEAKVVRIDQWRKEDMDKESPAGAISKVGQVLARMLGLPSVGGSSAESDSHAEDKSEDGRRG